jgi:mycothiol synthase
MSISLRRFSASDSDYEALVAIHNAVFPDYAERASDWQHWDSMRPEHCRAERWMAERDGAVVGFGQFFQVPWMYHPHKYFISIDVLPAYQRQGIGAQIYDHLSERLAPHDPATLRTDTREDQSASVSFITQRGFGEEMRSWESRLDVQGFDPSPWAGHEQRVLAKGVTIVTLRQLLDQGDGFKPELYEALLEMSRDVPRPDEFTPVPYAEWAKAHFEDENLLPEGYFIAIHQGGIAGVSQLWRHSVHADVLNTGLTATRRDYRRMGIALALKLRALAFARQQGIREVRTGNESNNRPMLSINEALGFVKEPAWVYYVKHIRAV